MGLESPMSDVLIFLSPIIRSISAISPIFPISKRSRVYDKCSLRKVPNVMGYLFRGIEGTYKKIYILAKQISSCSCSDCFLCLLALTWKTNVSSAQLMASLCDTFWSFLTQKSSKVCVFFKEMIKHHTISHRLPSRTDLILKHLVLFSFLETASRIQSLCH